MQIWKASLVLSLDENEHWKVFFNFKQAKGDYFEWEGKYSQREYVKRGSKWVVDSIPANITVSKQYSTYKAIKGFDHELSQQELTEIEQELKEAIVQHIQKEKYLFTNDFKAKMFCLGKTDAMM